jgi:hypothetical protein
MYRFLWALSLILFSQVAMADTETARTVRLRYEGSGCPPNSVHFSRGGLGWSGYLFRMSEFRHWLETTKLPLSTSMRCTLSFDIEGGWGAVRPFAVKLPRGLLDLPKGATSTITTKHRWSDTPMEWDEHSTRGSGPTRGELVFSRLHMALPFPWSECGHGHAYELVIEATLSAPAHSFASIGLDEPYEIHTARRRC